MTSAQRKAQRKVQLAYAWYTGTEDDSAIEDLSRAYLRSLRGVDFIASNTTESWHWMQNQLRGPV